MFGFWSAVRTLYGNKLDLSFRNVLTVFVLTGFGTINPPRELGHRKKKSLLRTDVPPLIFDLCVFA